MKEKISNQNISTLMDANLIQQETQAFDEQVLQLDEEMSGFTGKRDAEFIFQRKVEVLEKKKTLIDKKRELKKETYMELVELIESTESEVNEVKEQNSQIEVQIKELAMAEKNEQNSKLLKQLKELVTINETLKAQERNFKAG
eukprot:UN05001